MKAGFFGRRRRHRRRRHGECEGPGEEACALCLNDIDPGMSCRVERLNGFGAIRQRLLDLGLVQGAKVTLVRAAPLNDPIAIRIGDSILTVRRAEAATIEVKGELRGE